MIPQLGPVPSIEPAQVLSSDTAGARDARKTGQGTEVVKPAPESVVSLPENTTSVAAQDRPNLNPPDPNAPAGPSPAFEASILDRVREEALAPPELRPAPAPADNDAAPVGPVSDAEGDPFENVEAPVIGAPASADADAEPRPTSYDVPPSAEQRAEREVATIRRMETPYDTATVDVSR